MRVLGVDPGLTRCGVAVIDGEPGRAATLVHAGVIRTSPQEIHARRLVEIAIGLEHLLAAHAPDAVAIESVFSQHNVQSVIGTAQAAGVAMLVAARFGVMVASHTPTEVKAAVTGSGSASKIQVSNMVVKILGLSQAPTPVDATDACALALCHVWRGGMQAKLLAAQTRFRSS